MKVEEKNNIDINLNNLIKSLTSYCRDFESISVKISLQFPQIESEINSSIESYDKLTNILVKGNNDSNELKKFNSNLSGVITNLKESQENNSKIFSILSSSIATLQETITNIKIIDNLSEELKVFAVNSIVYAQHSGDKGRGYQFISAEFIKLSEEISSSTKVISKIGESLNNDITEVKEIINTQVDYNNNTITELSDETLTLITSSTKSISTLLDNLNFSIEKIRTIKDPINEIMVHIQVQDIIQQQLEHIISSVINTMNIFDECFRAINTRESSEEKSDLFTFLNFLIVVTETEVNRINQDILNLLQKVEKPLKEIMDVVSYVNDQSVYLKENTESETNRLIHAIFVAPQITISKIQNKIDINFEHKNKIEHKLDKIEDETKKQNEKARELGPLIERIKNLMFLAKVEKERSNLLIDLNAVKKQSIFSETTKDIIDNIDSSSKEYRKDLNELKSIFKNEDAEYSTIHGELYSSLEFLKKTEELFRDEFCINIDILMNLTNDITQYFNLFANLRNLNNNMKDKLSLLDDLKRVLDEQSESIGGLKKLNSNDFLKSKVGEVLNKLTVNEERMTIMDKFPELEIEIEKSEGSSITLF